jgi:hypothetical protein
MQYVTYDNISLTASFYSESCSKMCQIILQNKCTNVAIEHFKYFIGTISQKITKVLDKQAILTFLPSPRIFQSKFIKVLINFAK